MEELERMFDEGVDVAQYADYSDRPGLRQRRVGVDMPLAMIDRLDARASAAGVARQALIKSWLAERLDLEDRLDALAHLACPGQRPVPHQRSRRQKAKSPETRRRASPTPPARASLPYGLTSAEKYPRRGKTRAAEGKSASQVAMK